MGERSADPASAGWSAAAIRDAEAALAVGLPEGTLMARAAQGLADRCAVLLLGGGRPVAGARVVALIGAGSNGGDTLHAVAHLAHRGAQVTALLLADRSHPAGLAAATAAGAECVPAVPAGMVDAAAAAALGRECDLLLDGIVGIGGRGPLSPVAAGAYRAIRAAAQSVGGRMRTVAVDLPSGVNPDTGVVEDPTRVIHADLTVTFGCGKPCLLVDPGARYAGRVEVVDIGLGSQLRSPPIVRRVGVAEQAAVQVPLDEETSKYRRGVVAILAGSTGYPGAAVLALGAARRGGAGMVRGVIPRRLRAPLAVHYPEIVTEGRGNGRASAFSDPRVRAWGCGPGLGTGRWARWRLRTVLDSGLPVVLDADALTILARGGVTAHPGCILTPHEGEAERLHPSALAAGRLAGLAALVDHYRCTVLLKGHRTLIGAPDLPWVWVVDRAPSALATAGAGDVLTGLLASMLAAHAAAGRPVNPAHLAHLAAAAAHRHATSAEVLAARLGSGLVASDVIDGL